MSSSRLHWQGMKYRNVCRWGEGFTVGVDSRGRVQNFKFSGSMFEFSTENSHVSRRIKRQCNSIAGDSPNFKRYVISHVNPFTDLATQH